MFIMKKTNAVANTVPNTNNASFVISVIAASVSLAALIIAVIALVRSFGKNRIAEGEYDFFEGLDSGDYGDISEDDDNIGSDTLAF